MGYIERVIKKEECEPSVTPVGSIYMRVAKMYNIDVASIVVSERIEEGFKQLANFSTSKSSMGSLGPLCFKKMVKRELNGDIRLTEQVLNLIDDYFYTL